MPPKVDLDSIDLKKMYEGKKDYEKDLKKQQLKLLHFQQHIIEKNIPVVLAFEGWDASGKGGCIKRITEILDSRHFEVHQISAPTPTERAAHYLRRFWVRLPRRGNLGIFDRTWYGRVLVERVDSFARKEEWKRAYEEINTFEKMLADDGYYLFKFFLHTSPEVQLRRFKERQDSPYKQWKITEDDWHNRKKRSDYLKAYEDMLEKTNTPWAPWHIIEADYKWWARVRVLKIITKMLKKI